MVLPSLTKPDTLHFEEGRKWKQKSAFCKVCAPCAVVQGVHCTKAPS